MLKRVYKLIITPFKWWINMWLTTNDQNIISRLCITVIPTLIFLFIIIFIILSGIFVWVTNP
jgi:hypothetical protein